MRPALPAKPSHLSPMVNPTKTFNSSIVDKHYVNKVTLPSKIVNSKSNKTSGSFHPATPNSDTSGLVKASLATVIPTDNSSPAASDLDSKSIQLNLSPINANKNSINDDTENGAGDSEAGIKRVSSASIKSIRNSGDHVKFSFDDQKNKSTVKGYLPSKDQTSRSSLPPKQVIIYLSTLHLCKTILLFHINKQNYSWTRLCHNPG